MNGLKLFIWADIDGFGGQIGILAEDLEQARNILCDEHEVEADERDEYLAGVGEPDKVVDDPMKAGVLFSTI